jgi:hypothetical protein
MQANGRIFVISLWPYVQIRGLGTMIDHAIGYVGERREPGIYIILMKV